MGLRLEKQSLRVETIVGENTAQSVVEGSVSVPGNKPEIGRALSVKALPNIAGYDVVEGRVAFEGTIDVDLLYASFTEVESAGEDEGDEPELILEERLEKASFGGAMPFTFVLDVPGAESGMLAQAKATVDSVSFEVQGDQRTIDVDVVIEFAAVLKKVDDFTITTRAIVGGDVSVAQKELRMQTAAITGVGQAHVEGLLPFGGRTLPEQVLDLNLRPPEAPAVKVGNGMAEISGRLDCVLLYAAQEVGAASAEWTDALSYSAEVLLPDVVPHAKVDVKTNVTDVHWKVVDSDEVRGLALEATVLLDVRATSIQNVAIITDLVSESEASVAVRTEPLAIQEVIGEGVIETSASASLELPPGAAPIERILRTDARVRVEDVHVLGDKVAIEGVASLDLVYVGRNGDTTSLAATAWPASIPFDFEVAVLGAEPGQERRVELTVDKVSVDLINRETIDATVDLTAKVYLNRRVDIDAVAEAVQVSAPDPNPPTYTFVVLQEGDSLWQLAQKYHTDTVAIMQANKWLESEDAPLPVGAKLCIPRRRVVA